MPLLAVFSIEDISYLSLTYLFGTYRLLKLEEIWFTILLPLTETFKNLGIRLFC